MVISAVAPKMQFALPTFLIDSTLLSDPASDVLLLAPALFVARAANADTFFLAGGAIFLDDEEA